MNINEIIDKIRNYKRLDNQKAVAELFNISENNLSNMKKRGTLHYTVLDWAINENVSLDSLFYGLSVDKVLGASMAIEDKPDHGQALRMLLDILDSDDRQAKEAIYKNLEYFSAAVNRAKNDRRKVIDKSWPPEKERRKAIG